ncbi:DUF4160 domain-containing protein [Methylobacterium sp. Leaf113]|uniref:DUF4160 domain-containing protein n=1 Tax=Methylobacterium sp. Leaf113 TaxID=1736259 RepID=UPI00138F6139|nr:DUF4160 domain-containing protein [Methylobacterium sp. Leaf113]
MARIEFPIEGYILDGLNEAFALADPDIREDLDKQYKKLLSKGIRPRLVARIDGLSVKMWADEHPPPHFHVDFQGNSASFSIVTGDRLAGVRGLEKYDKQIRSWWQLNRPALIEIWNTTRPTNCPVGPIVDSSGEDKKRRLSLLKRLSK